MSDLSTVLEIVGSQAQKIAELKADKSGLNIALEIEATETDVLRQKIKEQAKEIERLKSLHKVPCSHCDATGGFNVESTGEIITCERCNGSGYHLVTPEQTTDSKEVTR
jgi:DnaJ-class molecular chaperone